MARARSRDEARRGTKTPVGPPMTLANMRSNGVRVVIAKCEACGPTADGGAMIDRGCEARTASVPVWERKEQRNANHRSGCD